jgi:hypothetical protein
MKGRIGNLVIAAVLLTFTLTLLLLAQFYWDYESNVIMFPWMAGTLIIGGAVWLLIRSWLTPVDVLAGEGESLGESDDPRAGLIKRLFWMASVYPLSYVFGMIIGLLVFTISYTSYHRLPWWQRVFAAVIVFVVVYVGFYKLLGVALPISPFWMRD